MKQYRLIILNIFIFLLLSVGVKAQDSQFSQFYSNPLYLSPSFAGSTAGTRFVMNFRDQWPSIPGAFITYSASLDHFFPQYNSGFDLLVFTDRAGSGKLSTTSIAMNYSYQIQISRKWQVRPALLFNYNNRSIDFPSLLFPDQMSFSGNSNTTIENKSFEKVNYLDGGISVMAYGKDLWFGFMLDHLMSPNQSLIDAYSKVPLKLRLYGGMNFVIRNRKRYNQETLKLAFSYKRQGQFDQLDLGVYWNRKPFVVGLWYRGLPLIKRYNEGGINHDALVFLFGYQFKTLNIGYSYDITISRIFSNTAGAHEISVIYLFNQNRKVRRKRRAITVPCPKF